jgi:hypothetical protein
MHRDRLSGQMGVPDAAVNGVPSTGPRDASDGVIDRRREPFTYGSQTDGEISFFGFPRDCARGEVGRIGGILTAGKETEVMARGWPATGATPRRLRHAYASNRLGDHAVDYSRAPG